MARFVRLITTDAVSLPQEQYITALMIGQPAPFTGDFEEVIMIEVAIEEMAGSD